MIEIAEEHTPLQAPDDQRWPADRRPDTIGSHVRHLLSMLGVVFLLTGCAGTPTPAADRAVAETSPPPWLTFSPLVIPDGNSWEGASRVVWVDAGAEGEDGDGSRARPYRSLERALRDGAAEVHLAAGEYVGEWRFPSGTSVVGHGEVLFRPSGPGPVLASEGALRLESLRVEGGEVGVSLAAGGMLRDVHFRGQTKAAVRVRGGRLDAERVRVELNVPSGMSGIEVHADAEARLVGVRIQGAYARGIALASGSRLWAQETEVHGAETGLYSAQADAELEDVAFDEGKGPAVALHGGRLKARRLRTFGHTYGLQSNEGAVIEGRALSFVRPGRAALALVQSKAHLSEVSIYKAGSHGGMQLLRSNVELEHLLILGAREYGISVNGGALDLRHAVIRDVTDASSSAGDGVHLRQTRAQLQNVHVQQAQGSCLLVAQGATLALSDASLRLCNWSALFVDSEGTVDGHRVEVLGTTGPAFALPATGTLTLEGVSARKLGQGWVRTECEQGAKVTLHRTRGPPVPAQSCLESSPAGQQVH